jgi:outer membrane protein TolC
MLSSLRLRAAGVLVWFFFWTAIPALAQEPLSLAAAQRAATLRSRELSGKESAAAAARDMSVAAGRLPDPMLQMGIDNLPVTGSDKFNLTSDFMTMRRIGIAQELTREDKRKAAAARYEREAEKIDAERQAAIADIQRQSAMAWLDRHFAERMLNAMDQQVAAAKLEIQAARSAYRAGRGTQADLIAAHAALAEMEDRRMEQTQRVARSRVALVRWVGEAGQGPLADPPALDAPPMNEDGAHHAIEKHPALVALKKQHEVALAEANIARASKKADWTVEISYAQRGPSFSNMVSIGVSVPLQWDQKRRQDREVSAKLALANDVLAQQEEAQRMHLAELQVLSTDWRSLRERADRYLNDIVPLSRERLRASLAAYAGGKANLTDLTAARRAELEATLRVLDLEAQAAQVWAQLKFLVPDESLDPVGATK